MWLALTSEISLPRAAADLHRSPRSTAAHAGDAYVVERELAGGGMNRVFVATGTALHRDVVIKVLPRELTGPLSPERFRRENRRGEGDAGLCPDVRVPMGGRGQRLPSHHCLESWLLDGVFLVRRRAWSDWSVR